ncbi:hypothetical protein MRB53_012935 [Persea americana]|uniref:Uncharacterized protein n=1 Tax=Persea americana TaxID=3435 RepID=A0ACC2LZN7_PERAE|nr:hypothetical protein MRB53_012935 [Persea americana]
MFLFDLHVLRSSIKDPPGGRLGLTSRTTHRYRAYVPTPEQRDKKEKKNETKLEIQKRETSIGRLDEDCSFKRNKSIQCYHLENGIGVKTNLEEIETAIVG